uniref:Uncharacterized protein n=1 Tax=Anguilla anguilla TaxID=7936 RepID=A0A0E9XHR9_ANGAN
MLKHTDKRLDFRILGEALELIHIN